MKIAESKLNAPSSHRVIGEEVVMNRPEALGIIRNMLRNNRNKNDGALGV